MRPHDTHPDAHRFQVEIYRSWPPARRFAVGLQMSEEVWEVAAARVRHRHPEYDDETVGWAIKRMRLQDDDLFRRVWPNAPIVAP